MNDLIGMDNPVEVKAPSAPLTLMARGRARSHVIYDFETRSGIYLSERERFAVDTFLATKSYTETARLLNEKYNSNKSYGGLKVWFARDHVKEYFKVRLEESGYLNGWTKDKWVAECTRRIYSPNVNTDKISKMYLELIGDALGYTQGGSSVGVKAENIYMDFRQGNGEK